ncbi:peptidase M13 family protein [Sphingomonas changbaiensis NBRC 104936]|uniref:Peptidase M13 family protein n=1 Tax=Sphingomonas changbaiensis NBRC 104936 TaxID=1219043 RepID=A0A0E9MRH3_9SPHN|nr:M13-type metalloendopeptidase [Sphingomonas changbaiensis]GAO39745.1 peptidase M13 family protein [Sphingomonas changbaiensis NBRC 104936]
MTSRILLGAAALALSTAAFAAGKPQLGDFGYDATGMDKTVAPGDDFYKYANGKWDAATPIPSDKSSWGGFAILRNLSDERTREVIQQAAAAKGAPGSNGQKVGDFYASFMDEAAIEAKGLSPIKPELDAIAALKTPAELAAWMGDANRSGVTVPVGVEVEQDLKDNTKYAIYVGQGGLGLPDRDYYLDDSNPKFVDARAKYKTHIAAMLKLAGIADADAKAERIFDLETKIAKTHWTRAQSRQIEKLYNPVATAELATKMPGLDWAAYLKAAGVDQAQVIVAQPSAVTGTAALIASEPLSVWQDYLTYHTLSNAAPVLPKAFVAEDFAFKGTTLAGTPELKARWKRAVDMVNGGMGEAVGQLYVAKYFPPEAKAKADQLVKNLIAAMDLRLQKLEWMAPETKRQAREKLAAFTPKIGYPDKWRDYSNLEIKAGDAFGNADRTNRFEYQRNLDKIGKPVDRTEWGMTPMTVNAYANPLMNEVVFPAAILQPPFFDPNADDAVNYGGIGAVIGHELSHHFDDQGRKFDKTGKLADWWTEQDATRFKTYTDRVVAQYHGYEPLPGTHVNGELTLGENMADLAGLNVAYDAYKISLGGKPAPVIDGWTGDQRFFLGYAQIYRAKYRDPILLQILTTDPHTPGNWRPYVVRNLDAWYTAFDVKPGSKYYLAPDQRIKVW